MKEPSTRFSGNFGPSWKHTEASECSCIPCLMSLRMQLRSLLESQGFECLPIGIQEDVTWLCNNLNPRRNQSSLLRLWIEELTFQEICAELSGCVEYRSRTWEIGKSLADYIDQAVKLGITSRPSAQ